MTPSIVIVPMPAYTGGSSGPMPLSMAVIIVAVVLAWLVPCVLTIVEVAGFTRRDLDRPVSVSFLVAIVLTFASLVYAILAIAGVLP